MERDQTAVENNVKQWLHISLAAEKLAELTVKITGTSEKGDGFLGDIIFADVQGTTKNGSSRTYKLVLKCSKNNVAPSTRSHIRASFQNEIYFYSKILPAFNEFQQSRGIADKNVFKSIPKYYGHCVTDSHEIIVLENLKPQGYELQDMTKPLSFEHLKLTLQQYAKFHAISAAISDQKPQLFERLVNGMTNMLENLDETLDFESFFGPTMDTVNNLIKDDMSEDTCKKWMSLREQIKFVLLHLIQDSSCFKVVAHADCWINNFMFRYEKDKSLPSEVMLLDWQMSGCLSPVVDLSYFLYSCISQEDLLENFDQLLDFYHTTFSSYVLELGSDPKKIYPASQLLEDWKKFSRFGMIFSTVSVKLAATEKEDIVDSMEGPEHGNDLTNCFNYQVKNEVGFKMRIKYLIQHAIDRKFI